MMERPDIDLNVRVPTRIARALADASNEFDLTNGEIIRQALQVFLFPDQQDARSTRIDDVALMARLKDFATGTVASSEGLQQFRDRLAAHDLEYDVQDNAVVLRAKPQEQPNNIAMRPAPADNYVQSFGHFPGHPHRSIGSGSADASFRLRGPKQKAAP